MADCRLEASDSIRLRIVRAAILVGSLCLVQSILYGSSLCGKTLLLPLDCLVGPLLSPEEFGPNFAVHNPYLVDAVFQTEPDRVFAVNEIRSGRIPLWNPYNYCGVPFLANNNSAVFSPFMLPSYLWPEPEVLAWTQLLKALVAGMGAYVFFRRVLEVGFWPAWVGGNCFPLIGYLVLWSWIHHSAVVAWLPWILTATHFAVRNPKGFGGIALGVVTCLTLLSGKLDTSGQVLLCSGLYAVWCLVDTHSLRGLRTRTVGLSAIAILGGWILGIGLAAPVVLPTRNYLQHSYRLDVRRQGQTDFPGEGLAAFPQLVLQNVYGTMESRSTYLLDGNHLESAAAGYCGLLVVLVLVPLGWVSGRKSANVCWAILGGISLVPHLRIPVIGDLFLLPPLNLLQNNRFIFLTAWCLLAIAVVGLDGIFNRGLKWRKEFWGFVAILAAISLFTGFRALELPAALTTLLSEDSQHWFRRMYWEAAGVSLLGVLLWFVVRYQHFWNHGTKCVFSAVIVCELVYNASGVFPQSDPALYYPELAVFHSLGEVSSTRTCSWGVSLPANLNRMYGLRAIDGYDGADPRQLIKLLEIANPRWRKRPPFAATRSFKPSPSRSPILDLLAMHDLIFRGEPPGQAPVWKQGDGYWVMENPNSLPRPYLPRTFETIENAERAFARLALPGFSPSDVAYVESPVLMPHKDIEGDVKIVEEVPGEITIRAEMKTSGLVVLQDLYFPGWLADVNGTETEVLRVNGALVGVKVPRGTSTVRLKYWPQSFVWGIRIAFAALIALLIWTVAVMKFGSSHSADNFEPGKMPHRQ